MNKKIKNGDLLKKISIKKSEEILIDLKRIYPLGKIDYIGEIKVKISYDNIIYSDYDIKNNSFFNMTARYLKIKSSHNQDISIYAGLGYYAERNEHWTSFFERRHGWSGADGIFSFNLVNEENYSQSKDKTLFVFGDTFYGHSLEDKRRLEPTAFLNNTFAYYQDKKINFEVARNSENALISLFEPNKSMQLNGYLGKNLVTYYRDIYIRPFVSAIDEKKNIELIFDFNDVHEFKRIEIENFYENLKSGFSDITMGVKEIDVLILENDEFRKVDSLHLDFYSKEQKLNIYDVDFKTRYIKFVISYSKNKNLANMIGLNKVYFYDEKGMLYDVNCSVNSQFSFDEEKPYSWFWLQDGIVDNNNFYIYPCIIEQEKNGIEGFEFKIKGVAALEMEISNGTVNYHDTKMKSAPLYCIKDNKEFVFPIAIMKDDDYYYFYGYCNERRYFLRSLIVGRILKNKLHDLNNLEYYSNNGWDRDFTNSKKILDHISCEMSVQKIIDGENKGKYLAVFQYDTNGPFVAYSIGESPVGPFCSPRIIYRTPEIDTYNATTYTYNAKAHLHLSEPKSILVSYNCNDCSMKANKNDYTIYHPRFLNFIDTSLK